MLRLLLALAIVCMPAAAATLTLEVVSSPSEPVRPEAGMGDAKLRITMDCQTAILVGPPPVSSQIPVTVSVNVSSQIYVTGPRTVLLEAGPCQQDPQGSVETMAAFQLTATRAAPGLTPTPITFVARGPEARSVGPHQLYADQADNVTIEFTAEYFPFISARVPGAIQEGGPGENLTFDIEVSNFGNAATRLTFEVANPVSDRWMAFQVPQDTALGTPALLGAYGNATVQFVVTLPASEGWNNGDQAFQLMVTPHAATDPTRSGNPVFVNLFARVRGMHCPGDAQSAMCQEVNDRGLDCSKASEECQELLVRHQELAQADAKSPGPALAVLAVAFGGAAVRRRR